MSEKEAGDGDKHECEVSPAVREQEKELAQSALSEYNRKNYPACLQHLSRLEAQRPQDVKCLHNKAVAELYQSGVTKTDQFQKTLQQICTQAHINLEGQETIDDAEYCIFYYNRAVLLYHQGQYSKALRILSKIFSFVEPMNDRLSQRISLLLVQLHLCTYQPERAISLIDYVENQISVGGTGASAKASSKDKDAKNSDKENKDEATGSTSFRLRLQQLRARSYLMNHSLKACKRELKNVMTSGGVNAASIYLKGNLEYQRENYRKAIKVLNSVPHSTLSFKDTGECPGVLYYNNMGCIHLYMGKPNLASFYLHKALQENDASVKALPKQDGAEMLSGRPLFLLGASRRPLILYNLGVSLLHAGHPSQAFDCLLEASQAFPSNPRLWLRLAECAIEVHKPDNEGDFRIQERRKDMVQGLVGSGMHRKIILASRVSQDSKYCPESQSSAMPMATLEFSSLCLRNAIYLLPSSDEARSSNAGTGSAASSTDNSLPTPGLSSSSTTTVHSYMGTTTIGPAPSVPEAFTAAPSNPLRPSEIAALRCAILCASAYVCLCLGDYVVALEHANNLLAQPKLSGAHTLLGHLYAAEALILMDRISDAISHLNPEHIQDLSVVYPIVEKESDKDKDKEREKSDSPVDHFKPIKSWFPNTVPTAHAILQYNLAVAYTLRGELEKSADILKQIWKSHGSGCDVPIHVIMMALYIEAQLGHADSARSILKQHCPQYRVR